MKHRTHKHAAHHTHHPTLRGFDIRRANWLVSVVILLVIAAIFYIFIIPAAHAPGRLTTIIGPDTSSWQKYTDSSGFTLRYPANFVHNQLVGTTNKKNIIHEFTDKKGSSIRIALGEGFSYQHGATVGETLIGKYKATTYFSAQVLTVTNFGIDLYPRLSLQIESSDPQLFEAVLSSLDLSQIH